MTVSVSPSEFKFVAYDAEVIREVAEELLESIDLGDRDLHIDVDETTPLTRMRVEIGDTIAVRAESGAFEDTKRPRQQSRTTIATSLGRVLLRVADRLSGNFDDAPPDEELTLAQMAAWETYCVGRLGRLGVPVNQQRWRYNFRNRHGFSDAVDAEFDRIWGGTELSWADLTAVRELL
jgi:hypothetical protein